MSKQVRSLDRLSDATVAGPVANEGTLAAARIGLLANEWALGAAIFVLTRVVAVLGAYSGMSQLIQVEPQRNKGWLAEVALMWDSAWYASIAQQGYQWHPAAEGGTNVAFAPLYPLLLRGGSRLLSLLTFGWDFGNAQYGSLIATGLLISNLCFFVALVLLIKLLAPRLGKPRAALVALALAALPLSFFFSALYTEGPFLMLALAALLVARTEHPWRWAAAGAIGFVASTLKFAGVLLLPVLLVEYLSQVGWQPRRLKWDVLWLAVVPLGMGVYVAYLAWRFGQPFAFMDSELKGWNHQASFFLVTYWNSLATLWQSLTGAFPPGEDPVLGYGSGNRLYLVLDLGMPLVLICGAFLARKKLLASEWAWLALGIIYPLSANITFSMARYVLPLWPGLVWLGLLRRRYVWVYGIWLAASLLLLAWCASIFGGARWIG